MMRTVEIVAVVTLVLLATPRLGAQKLGLYETLARPILAPNQPTVEVKTYTASRVPPLPAGPRTARRFGPVARAAAAADGPRRAALSGYARFLGILLAFF